MASRVILIEDHFLARMALRSVLSGRDDIVIVGEASDGASGVEMYRQCSPDVTVMDLRLPGVNGFDAIAAIRKLCKTAKIAVLSNYEGSEDIYRAIRNGAMAYLNKNASGEELVEAIVTVHKGMRYLPPVARDRLAERTSLVELTPREHEVLTCITRGQSNRDIAQQLRIAEKTVRIHVSSVLDKMGVRDRTQAAICAIQRGLVHWESDLTETVLHIGKCPTVQRGNSLMTACWSCSAMLLTFHREPPRCRDLDPVETRRFLGQM